MNYPSGFPAYLHGPVDAALTRAQLDLSTTQTDHDSPSRRHELGVRFAIAVFEEFSRQAVEAIRRQVWSGEDVRSAIDDLLRRLTVEAYYCQKRQVFEDSLAFSRRMEESVRESSAWREHLARLAQAFDGITPAADDSGASATPNPAALPAITSAVIKRRKRLVDEFRREHEMKAADFARHIRRNQTTIYGIIKEDRARFSDASRDHLLEKLGVTLEQWYRP
jgi:hypothetical protein